ncbi:MAG: DUF111 family protein [Lachnospiraceae bacterium]|nr:DUF111 family protein [Lachnospiraceae bacterium]
MKLYSKKGILFLVQLDHLCGEILGDVIESFYQAGAKNVQILNTITKKNRPGYVVLIDGNEASSEAIEAVIVEECGSSGWHRIDTCHRHTDVFYLQKTVHIELEDGTFDFQIKGKQIADREQEIRPEYDSCDLLRKELLKYGKKVSIRQLQFLLAQAFRQEGESRVLL